MHSTTSQNEEHIIEFFLSFSSYFRSELMRKKNSCKNNNEVFKTMFHIRICISWILEDIFLSYRRKIKKFKNEEFSFKYEMSEMKKFAKTNRNSHGNN